MLTVSQIEELQNIVRDNHSIFILNSLGSNYLFESDKQRLLSLGINLDDFSNSYIKDSFFLGVLVDSVGLLKSNNINYQDLKTFIKSGQYLPLTSKEIATLSSIENQSLKDIRGLQGKIFSDVNQILLNNSRIEQELFIKESIKEGVLNKKTVDQISRDISDKTGDWSRDFDRIVQYTTQLAYEEGKAASIEKYSNEKDSNVYKVVYNQACRHCIRLYLTGGINSQPRIFRLSELKKNGTNIGKKVDDWLPTIGPVHPYCRCQLRELRNGEAWNDDTKSFELNSNNLQSTRKRVKIQIGDKTFIG